MLRAKNKKGQTETAMICTDRLYFILLFFSGIAALLYEVLWMNDLALLFGNTAQATAATLTAFFSGMALGSWFWARLAKNINRPLRVFAGIELTIAVSVLGFWGIFSLYQQIYPSLALAEASHGLRIAVKFGLAWLILLPPAFCMGGTLPMLSQHLVQNRGTLGRQVAGLYAANTLGGVLGVLLAGFLLPPWIGYHGCYVLAMLLNVLVALTAWRTDWLTQGQLVPSESGVLRHERKKAGGEIVSLAILRIFTFMSGVLTLALQVLWVRMFAQVLQNSVQTFALILLIFLLTLAFSAGLVNRLLARSHWQPAFLLFAVVSGAALLLPLSTFSFVWLSNGLDYFGGQSGWWAYQLQVLGLLLIVMLPPLMLLGCVLPLLVKLAERNAASTGALVGKLMALNTLGAIFGSFSAGFILLELLGLWHSLFLVCLLLWCGALCLQLNRHKTIKGWSVLGLGFCVLAGLFLAPLPNMHKWPGNKQLLFYAEGSAASVAVLAEGNNRSLVVNNHYILGGTGMNGFDTIQGLLPILLHPAPKSVFTLGMGTGVTAGATLQFDIQKLVVSELLPEVITAAQAYFSEYSYGLFSDPRARVVEEDGRNYLLGSNQRFDVIIGDLFVPWSAGAGALYSREHFATVQKRLNDGGIFMQWLPSYQLSEYEFGIIVRTLLDVFPCVSLWRNDFVANLSAVGLLAEQQCRPLRTELTDVWLARPELNGDQVPLLAHYVAELSAYRDVFAQYPLNTDNKPVIEFLAPKLQRQRMAKEMPSFNGRPLLNLTNQLQNINVLSRNKHLSLQTSNWQSAPKAGFALQQFALAVAEKNGLQAKRALENYQTIMDTLR